MQFSTAILTVIEYEFVVLRDTVNLYQHSEGYIYKHIYIYIFEIHLKARLKLHCI